MAENGWEADVQFFECPAGHRSAVRRGVRRFLSHSKKTGTSSVIDSTMASALVPTQVKATASDCINCRSLSARPPKIPAQPRGKRAAPAIALRRKEIHLGNRNKAAIKTAAPTNSPASPKSIRPIEHNRRMTATGRKPLSAGSLTRNIRAFPKLAAATQAVTLSRCRALHGPRRQIRGHQIVRGDWHTRRACGTCAGNRCHGQQEQFHPCAGRRPIIALAMKVRTGASCWL